MPALTAAGPALVHFIDFAQLNSVRTLPYLAEWDRRYREAGLSTIAVQAPRFPFGAERGERRGGAGGPRRRDPGGDRREGALARVGCEGWPSLFLWSLGGALACGPLRRGRIRGDRGSDPGRAAGDRRAAGAAGADGAPARERRARRPGDGPDGPRTSRAAAGSGPGSPARTARTWRWPTRPAAPGRRSRATGEIAVELDGAAAGSGRRRRPRRSTPWPSTRATRRTGSSCALPRASGSGRVGFAAGVP